jgi:hypothetical protein
MGGRKVAGLCKRQAERGELDHFYWKRDVWKVQRILSHIDDDQLVRLGDTAAETFDLPQQVQGTIFNER